MKSFIYDENNPPSKEELLDALFLAETDPRSVHYERKLNRPSINWFLIVLFLFIWILLVTALVFVLLYYKVCALWIVISSILLSVIYCAVFSKSIVITSIHLYQRYAPDSIRKRCRFEPSCSEYMLLAIDKYGLFRGVLKGINRIKRCNANSGGFDYP